MRDVKKARLATIGGVLVAGLALAACGGGTSHAASVSTGATTTTTAGGGGGRGGAALAAFTSCMSSHGVKITVPTRPRNGNGTPPSTTPGETRPARNGGAAGAGGFGAGFANRFDTPPAGVDPAKYSTALAACKSKLPTGGGNFQNNTAFRAYASCLKDHGVTLPGNRGGANGGTASTTTPTTGTGTSGTTPTTFNRNDPKVQAALKTCRPLLPAGGLGRSASTTTTTPSA